MTLELTRIQDIEAQNQNPPHLIRTTTAQSEYAQVGRGGAGNVVLTTEAEAASSELARVTTSRTLSGVASAAKKAPQVYQGHGGRGGAGNWRGNLEEEKKVREAEEERAMKDVERRVQDEVLLSLKAPEKAYRAPREAEKVGK